MAGIFFAALAAMFAVLWRFERIAHRESLDSLRFWYQRAKGARP